MISLSKARQVVNNIDLSWYPVPISVKLSETSKGVDLDVIIYSKDRDKGTPRRVTTGYECTLKCLTQKKICDLVQDCVKQIMSHEVDELFKGVRIYDPH